MMLPVGVDVEVARRPSDRSGRAPSRPRWSTARRRQVKRRSSTATELRERHVRFGGDGSGITDTAGNLAFTGAATRQRHRPDCHRFVIVTETCVGLQWSRRQRVATQIAATKAAAAQKVMAVSKVRVLRSHPVTMSPLNAPT